jgi:hypothetical protein
MVNNAVITDGYEFVALAVQKDANRRHAEKTFACGRKALGVACFVGAPHPRPSTFRHCERSEAIHSILPCCAMDCFAALAMTMLVV